MNHSSKPVVIVRIAPAKILGDLQLVGIALYRKDENNYSIVGTGCGPFPPPLYKTYQPGGYTIQPGKNVDLMVGIGKKPGELRNLDVWYRVGKDQFHVRAHYVVSMDDKPIPHTCPKEGIKP